MGAAERCPRCGTAFVETATPEGLCPHCLFDVADAWDPGVDFRRACPEGTRLGRYEIVSSLGEGGMGEVYRARDLRLGRTVAIKLLPAELSADPILRRRLEREAQLASSLNHPHICRLLDVGEDAGVAFLVMECLEGETLLARLRRGALPIDQVLQHAVEIADALDEAHRHGVVHRDLKPGNIMLTASGAKLLDFGLAKLHATAPAALLSGVPIVAADAPLSGERSLIGTIRYMSPEQLEGREADPRSDLFSLGLVIYEMAAGHPPFSGASDASVMAALLSPRPERMPLRDVPEPLADIVDTCLARNPDDRWQTAKDVLLQLKRLSPRAARRARDHGSRRFGRALVSSMAAACVLTAAATVWSIVPERPRNGDVIRFSPSPPAGSSHATLSPDGRRLVWVALERTETRLFVQPLDSLSATVLEGTEGAQAPFWSPDSASIGFFAGGQLKRVAASGGPPMTVAPAAAAQGGAWNGDGTIVFAASRSGGLSRVNLGGGAAVPVTEVNRRGGETSHRWPAFLPDGQHVVYLAVGNGRESGVLHIGSLGGDRDVAIGQADSGAIYAREGYLLFVLKGTLMAQRIDARSLQTRGDPVPVARNAAQDLVTRSRLFSASDAGALVYHRLTMFESRLVWFDRTGRLEGAALAPGLYGDPALSPDSTTAVFARSDPEKQTSDIWRLDLVRGGVTRVTASNANALRPIWSPRADQVLFTMRRSQMQEMYRVGLGGGPEQLIQRSTTNQAPSDWRADGQLILYENIDAVTNSDLWVLPARPGGVPVPYLRTPFNETRAKFSPDGRWVSYTSDESGTSDVYIQPFPISGKKWQVSVRGGKQAVWRRDGKEIFYLAPDRRLMAVPVRASGATLELGAASPLFQIPAGATSDTRFSYDVSADGQRFLVNVGASEGPIQPLSATVVINWPASLQRGGRHPSGG